MVAHVWTISPTSQAVKWIPACLPPRQTHMNMEDMMGLFAYSGLGTLASDFNSTDTANQDLALQPGAILARKI